MKCIEIKDLMSAYIDNELTLIEREEFESHIAHCEECKLELDMLTMMIEELQNEVEVELPTDFHQSLMDRLDEEDQEQPTKKPNKIIQLFKPKFIAPLATAACVAFVVFAWNQNQLDSLQDQSKSFSTDSIRTEDTKEEAKPEEAKDMGIMFSESKADRSNNERTDTPPPKSSNQMIANGDISFSSSLNNDPPILKNGQIEAGGTIVSQPEIFDQAIEVVKASEGSTDIIVDVESFFMLQQDKDYGTMSGMQSESVPNTLRLKEIEVVEGVIKIDIVNPEGKVIKTYTLSASADVNEQPQITIENTEEH